MSSLVTELQFNSDILKATFKVFVVEEEGTIPEWSGRKALGSFGDSILRQVDSCVAKTVF